MSRWFVSDKAKAKKKGRIMNIAMRPNPGNAKSQPDPFERVNLEAIKPSSVCSSWWAPPGGGGALDCQLSGSVAVTAILLNVGIDLVYGRIQRVGNVSAVGDIGKRFLKDLRGHDIAR